MISVISIFSCIFKCFNVCVIYKWAIVMIHVYRSVNLPTLIKKGIEMHGKN